MSTSKKRVILRKVTVKLGCNSSCRRPKLSSIFHPKTRRHNSADDADHKNPNYSSSNSPNTTATGLCPSTSPAHYSSDAERAVQGFGRIGGESVAVAKDSDDPYVDFRHSMLQMILEKEIYSKDELRELLSCFLQLNSPYYHEIIVKAFTEIWHCVFSVNPGIAGDDSPFLQTGDSDGGVTCLTPLTILQTRRRS